MLRIVALAAGLALAACAHKQPEPQAKAEEAAGTQVVKNDLERLGVAEPVPAPAPAEPAAAPCAVDAACGRPELCVGGACVAATAERPECRPTVHFDFDRSDLHEEELPLLRRVPRCFAADPTLRVRIEGHSDERGTEEYNLALGDRRAHAVRTYLVNLGVPTAGLKTVSFGKLRPLCPEHDESCWMRNRRSELHQAKAIEPQAAR